MPDDSRGHSGLFCGTFFRDVTSNREPYLVINLNCGLTPAIYSIMRKEKKKDGTIFWTPISVSFCAHTHTHTSAISPAHVSRITPSLKLLYSLPHHPSP